MATRRGVLPGVRRGSFPHDARGQVTTVQSVPVPVASAPDFLLIARASKSAALLLGRDRACFEQPSSVRGTSMWTSTLMVRLPAPEQTSPARKGVAEPDGRDGNAP